MDYIYWIFGYTDTETAITTTIYKNKNKMNSINNEIILFNKSKLKKTKTKNYVDIISEIKTFDIKQLKHVNIENDNISIESDITIEYDFDFNTDSDSIEYEYDYDISLNDIINQTLKFL